MQNKDDPNIIDLVDTSNNPYYRKRRVQGTEYKIDVYGTSFGALCVMIYSNITLLEEPLSESLLASVTAPNATSKVKVIELHNPSQKVELKYTGTLTFKWRFEWEQYVLYLQKLFVLPTSY